MQIDFLWYEDCPSHEQARQLLDSCLKKFAEEHPEFDYVISSRRVQNADEAKELDFPGSPTIRINGVDVDPEGASSNPVGLTCRVYIGENGRFGPLPSRERIRKGLERAWEETE